MSGWSWCGAVPVGEWCCGGNLSSDTAKVTLH